jgi:hypothetical protein
MSTAAASGEIQYQNRPGPHTGPLLANFVRWAVAGSLSYLASQQFERRSLSVDTGSPLMRRSSSSSVNLTTLFTMIFSMLK